MVKLLELIVNIERYAQLGVPIHSYDQFESASKGVLSVNTKLYDEESSRVPRKLSESSKFEQQSQKVKF